MEPALLASSKWKPIQGPSPRPRLIMARGRPKVSVSPCRFCNMQFKRVEHLQRHERIRGFISVPSLSLVIPYMAQIRRRSHFLVTVDRNSLDGRFSMLASRYSKWRYLMMNRDLLMRHRRLSHHEPPTETTAVNTSQDETTTEQR
jgi:hypothetical protein